MTINNHWQVVPRPQLLNSLEQTSEWDVVVIGGGITGAGILREAAKHKLKCLLVEQQDFAWGTSSRSSKMVHGGLRYLASGDLKLTRDAVRERRRLLKEAPGLVDDLHFVMPHFKGGFPGPKLFNQVLNVYDAMAGKQNHEFYPAASLSQWVGGVKSEKLLGATRFADAITDDARLTLRVLDEARLDGAVAVNYLGVISFIKSDQRVSGVRLSCALTGEQLSVRAKVVINASGAWTDELRSQLQSKQAIRPLRGSHLVLPFWRLPLATTLSFPHPQDKRPVFAFPWLGSTVIGTTDLDHKESMNFEAAISQEEIDYLLAGVNDILPLADITQDDIQATWAGVRPVVAGSAKDPSKEKRDHAIWNDKGLISVAGGKLTTFRLIALDVLKQASKYLPQLAQSTHSKVFLPSKQNKPSHINTGLWQRLQGYYGARVQELMKLDTSTIAGTPYLWAEVQWAAKEEAVQHLDDLLIRRTRLGLLLPQGAAALHDQLQEKIQPLLGWNDEQWQQEWQRYQVIWNTYYGTKPTSQPAKVA